MFARGLIVSPYARDMSSMIFTNTYRPDTSSVRRILTLCCMTEEPVASALLSSVRGCHAGAFAVPMSKYSACKCPKGVLHVSRHLRRHLWQSRRCPPLISYARSNLRWTVPHAAQIIMLALKTTYVALSRHNLPHTTDTGHRITATRISDSVVTNMQQVTSNIQYVRPSAQSPV